MVPDNMNDLDEKRQVLIISGGVVKRSEAIKISGIEKKRIIFVAIVLVGLSIKCNKQFWLSLAERSFHSTYA